MFFWDRTCYFAPTSGHESASLWASRTESAEHALRAFGEQPPTRASLSRGRNDFGERASEGMKRNEPENFSRSKSAGGIRFSAIPRTIPESFHRGTFWLHLLRAKRWNVKQKKNLYPPQKPQQPPLRARQQFTRASLPRDRNGFGKRAAEGMKRITNRRPFHAVKVPEASGSAQSRGRSRNHFTAARFGSTFCGPKGGINKKNLHLPQEPQQSAASRGVGFNRATRKVATYDSSHAPTFPAAGMISGKERPKG